MTPLTHWQITPIHAQEYNVPDAPMKGEMDSLFFLTKDKNVIPHTYPCRTAYQAEVQGVAPTPVIPANWDEATQWLPFGAPLLDLSGFWFRATRLAFYARTEITAKTAQDVALRLGTCGAAQVWLNDRDIGWLAPATRNAMAHSDMTLPLSAGVNTLTIYVEDLAERDARILLSAELDADLPHRAPCDNPKALAAIEATLTEAHFDRLTYDTDPITLCLPQPLPQDATLTIRVAGDFMSHSDTTLTHALPAGTTRVDLGSAHSLPADYRHFDLTLTMDGTTAQRTLGVELSHHSRQGPAVSFSTKIPTPGTPPLDEGPHREGVHQTLPLEPITTVDGTKLAPRINEALTTVAQTSEPDTVTALACLATNTPGAEEMIRRTLPTIEACWDCADFALVPLIWARARFADQLTELLPRIDEAILRYRYWMDEPGNDVQWYFSENHALLFHTSAYLAGHLFPDATFKRSQRVGTDQSAVGAARVRAWFDHFEAAEMAEFNSAPYFPIDLKGLTALYALAPDGDIRERAAKGIDRLIEIVANSAHHGVNTGAQGRSYEHTLCAGETLELSAIARLLWGQGSIGARVHALPLLALALRDHGLVLPDLTDRAIWTRDDAQEWCFWQGQGGFARLYHHKTAETALGSAALYRWGDWGYQETLIHARIGRDPMAQLWINMPGEMKQSGYARPSYWGGSASVPRVQQYRDLAIVAFDGEPPQPDLTHAWFPTAHFDRWDVSGDTATASAGGGHLTLRATGPLELITTGPSANAELRTPGRRTTWVLRLSQSEPLAMPGPPAIQDLKSDTWVVDDSVYGPVTFHPDGRVEAEGRTLDPKQWTLHGTRANLPLIGR